MVQEQLQLLWHLVRKIKTYQYIFIWFADYHSFLPILFSKWFRKKSVIVLGGYDVYCIPELGYGVCSSRLRNIVSKFAINNAQYVAPLTNHMTDHLQKNSRIHMHGKIRAIPQGFDSDKWYCDEKKSPQIAMVAKATTSTRIRIKGIDRFVEIAHLLPQYNFILIGLRKEFNELNIPENMTVYPFIDDLRQAYSRAMVYCLFSLSEGFPTVLGESMLCKCIPVCTNVGGVKDIVRDKGLIIENFKAQEVAKDLVRIIENYSADQGNQVREHIIENFPLDRRSQELIQFMKT